MEMLDLFKVFATHIGQEEQRKLAKKKEYEAKLQEFRDEKFWDPGSRLTSFMPKTKDERRAFDNPWQMEDFDRKQKGLSGGAGGMGIARMGQWSNTQW